MTPETPHGVAETPKPTTPSSETEVSAQPPRNPLWATWPPLLLIPCLPCGLLVYNMGPLGALALPCLGYMGACVFIAPAQLVYGLILASRKQPRANLHIGSAITLGFLLLLAFFVLNVVNSAGGVI